MSAVQRAEKVVKMAKGIKTNVRMLAEVEAADVGKSTHDAEMAISGAAGEGEHWCLYAATLDAEQDMPVGPTASGDALPLDVVYRRDPIGVVGLISAWNYPINVAFRKVAPALIAGNTVVLKPSELGGLAVMYLAQLAHDAGIPKGVFNVVMGDRDAGQTLAEHPDVGMISFTGSTATGSKIMQSCAPRLAQNMLELGGKSALVVFEDVDVQNAVDTVMTGFLTNGGQICTAHTRLIVHKSIEGKVLAKLQRALEKLPYLDDSIAETRIGDMAWEEGRPMVVQPVVCRTQYDKIITSINGAKAAGIETLAGPDQASMRVDKATGKATKGFYIPPTVFINVPKDAWIWQNEVFGPVLAVRTFTTEEEAVVEANSTRFGLASTVMSTDPARARRVANQIRAGAVYATATGHGILFEFPNVQRGGYGCSGVGRELGLGGLHEYTELKSINYSGFKNSPVAAQTAAAAPAAAAAAPAVAAAAPVAAVPVAAAAAPATATPTATAAVGMVNLALWVAVVAVVVASVRPKLLFK